MAIKSFKGALDKKQGMVEDSIFHNTSSGVLPDNSTLEDKLLEFSFDMTNISYVELKHESQRLVTIQKYSFIALAIRLKKIRDSKMYLEEYSTFDDFIEKEIDIQRRSVYNYIKILEVYAENIKNVQSTALLELSPSKLSETLAIISESPNLRDDLFEYSLRHSQREVRNYVQNLKDMKNNSFKKNSKPQVLELVIKYKEKLPQELINELLKYDYIKK